MVSFETVTKARYATSSGRPPHYVVDIEYLPGRGGTVRFAGGTTERQAIRTSSRQDLPQQVRLLAAERVLFGVGEQVVWNGTQDARFPFLLITFTGGGKWQIHEIIPGASPPWERVELSELLGSDWPGSA
jgi:hypothetical protein